METLFPIGAYTVGYVTTSTAQLRCLGIGFALVTPTLNVPARTLESDAPDQAVLVVNALLSGSAAAAPLLLIVCVRLQRRGYVFAFCSSKLAFVYGLCEQLNGSWASIYMTQHVGASLAYGSIALALFWAVATGFRVVFAVFGRVFAPPLVFCT